MEETWGVNVLATERHNLIVEHLRLQRSVSVTELVDMLNVSAETVRRDLDKLDRDGLVRKVRGGAVRLRHSLHMEPSFSDRQNLASEEKRHIARVAAELVGDARTLFLDLGTTAVAVAHELQGSFRGTVVTPSLRVGEVLSESPNITVLLPGGVLRGGDMSVSGSATRSFLSEIYPDLAFIGTGGVDVEAGITDFELTEVDSKRIVIANSDRTFALADSSKFGAHAPYRVCATGDIEAIIADPTVRASDLAAFEARDLTVLAGSLSKFRG